VASGMAANERAEDIGDASQDSPQLRGRPLRSPKPSTKVREALSSFEGNARTTRRTGCGAARQEGAPVLDGRTTVAQRLLAEVGSSRQNFEELKDIIKQQTGTLISELVRVNTKLAVVESELSDTKKRMAEDQKHMAEDQKHMAEVQRRMAEEQKRMAEELKRMAEEQKQMAEKQEQMARELEQAYTRLEAISNTWTHGTSMVSDGTGPTSGSAGLSNGSSPQTYASVLTKSINPSSSASQPKNGRTSAQEPRPNAPPGVTIDTRRAKDQSKAALDNIPETEQRIKATIQAIEGLKEVEITGIQVRGHNVRVLTPTEREAALLRTNDKWIHEIFEGARTRGEDWHPIKIDDVVKAAVMSEDAHTIKDSFAQTFCAENGVSGVMKSFWLSKGDKRTGSMAVFLASATEAGRLRENRLVKVGGQIAFASEYQRMPRPNRCYNCNRYGHRQARCVFNTTCGRCAGDHRTDSCTATEKKCPACGEAHAATDPGCPVYKREKANLMRALRQPDMQTRTSIIYA
jgi:hypothetical protein